VASRLFGRRLRRRAAVLVLERRQFQPVGFFRGGIEQAQRGALGIQIPQPVDAQQALAVRQRGSRSLAAVGLHQPMPVERMRFAARQTQPGQTAEEARRGIEYFGQQRIADVAAEPRVAATLAHALRQAEHGGGQSLLVRLQRRLRQMPAVQRHRPRVAAVFGGASSTGATSSRA
jgi:hypothetical protein